MRKEPYTVGDFIHVYNRGNRKQPIVLDTKDQWRFLLMLRYFNDEHSSSNPLRYLLKSDFNRAFEWPPDWPAHKPLVNIVCFTLMPNHYHLILEEISEGGITKFMRKFGTGMTNYFNTKHKESGRLFQGAFKAKRIDAENYLSYLTVYIQVKNVFELYAGGIKKAVNNFDDAFRWAVEYPYSSLADYADNRNSPIVEKSVAGGMFSSVGEYRNFSKQCMLNMNLQDKLGDLAFE
ncbi:MAG: hypothetical protein A2528_01825 [Candidatus Staskawiczbacteria bacterium RIFOXYD2_FULL_37_9]|uniref:Transposase IS200-like domain-containing protein n=1 Tax=Candidatus Staskawiczbacteria bacterium RIFOXYB1_FULL_37_44 TaxID=1802223 RepID=A0A1G2IZ24_9BACT|nr:MAG: hypothetical protein A2358_01340 [Candidatus Staskawiczbacteria bacterium RIFOXYB1_FULL_37_44]OGZ83350.1 MAG: hypothetical protein A2416_02075 [Candidatus Staskawiczbacteria bacterium RIFOXYC1_FULL_37_52]OGZ88753.1 MAG: hypothetical protein A2581_03015 [Candidatus Staskawiczbacteria bacterium RIFOXYD1_FULL_37_110]OGZ89486.1 MAG: hypothetical protein A2444_02990 [Candidatus Staskawiczbacteria bacterium RIFOXYC2_FULL_37_19]OGZ93563.1 MAG: hypothetical protein A2528_01825 [Candidatus Stask